MGGDLIRRIAVVLASQAAVFGLVILMATAGIVFLGRSDEVYPRVLRVPVEAKHPGAAVQAATRALSESAPGADVSLEGDEFVVGFGPGEADVPAARAALEGAGFDASRFTIGRDVHPARMVPRLLDRPLPLAIVLLLFPFGLATVAAWAMRRHPPRFGRRPAWRSGRSVVFGVAGGVALAGTTHVLALLLERAGYVMVEQPWIAPLARANEIGVIAPFLVLVVVIAPVAEELFYRAWAFAHLREASVGVAFVVSCALFAAAHLHAPAVPAYVVMGLALGGLYHVSNSLTAPIIAHATNNAIAVATLLA